MSKKYDYIIIGSGLFGATFAYLAMQKGKTCLVVEKRNEVGGNQCRADGLRREARRRGSHPRGALRALGRHRAQSRRNCGRA